MTGRTDLVTIAPAQAHGTFFRAPLVSPARRASRVHAKVWRVRTHLGGRRAQFMLRVENRSDETVETLTYALSRTAQAGAGVPISVPPGASLAVSLSLDLPRERPARAVTEASTQAGTLVFEECERPRKSLRLILALCAVGVTAGAGIVGSGLLGPSVTALAAPHGIRASRPFAVAYAFSRADVADYSIVSAEGAGTARGTLDATSGSFDVALPHESEPHAYDISVRARSRFGAAVRTVRVLAQPDPRPLVATRAPTPHPRAPRAQALTIDRLALQHDSVVGGRPIVVYYEAGSVDGMVRLIDQLGTVRAEALLGRRGNSILLAPYVDADQDFRVVVDATTGAQRAQKSIALRVTKARSLDDALATARRKNDGPIALVDRTVAPGDPIVIGIVKYQPGMRVALVDPQGQEVAASAVTADQNAVTLTAPTVAGNARYTVTATFANGPSEETVIRNVTIAAATPP